MAAEPYTSYEAAVIGAAVRQLAAVPAFQVLVGAANAAAAQGWIIELDGGPMRDGSPIAVAANGATLNLSTALAWAHVAPEPAPVEAEAVSWLSFLRSGSLDIDLWLRRVDALPAPEQLRRALNSLGAVRAGFEALWGTHDTYFLAGNITSRLNGRGGDTGWARDLISATLTIHWRDTP
jgi:hypothetical protein